ncbi:MAG: chloride channel protein, partial [Deltaproteobacteria bacterium]|nr:chloride channel protein [Deltaproteobacteria bacterium]
ERLSWWVLLALVGVKILATSWTIGGGMSGGIFAPSLFVGAMLGGAFGHLMNSFAPAATAGPGAYAVVGMAAVVAGTTHAPFTAFLILFEMTGGYDIILPLMIACIVSTFVASQIRRESIYTLKLLRRGVDIRAGKEVNLLRSLKVGETMTRRVESVPQDMKLGEFMAKVARSPNATFPVVDPQGRLVGIVSHADYIDYAFDADLHDIVVVKEIANKQVETVTPQDNLETALEKISTKDYATLPVIDSETDQRLVGIISRGDITSAYSRYILKTKLAK